MESKVTKSTYSKIMTTICAVLMIGISVYWINRDPVLGWVVLSISILWFAAAVFYAPCAIVVDGDELKVKRLLKSKRIALGDVDAVERLSPTAAERRLLGSGGFFGYWGRFSEPSIGRYFAYYGKASDCFLITLKNGRMYMLGCENPDELASLIASRLSQG